MKQARNNRRSDRRIFAGRTLDVSLREDPRNEAYLISQQIKTGSFVAGNKLWACEYVLDQGSEGACVGFAGAHWFGAESRPQPVQKRVARQLYKGAQKHDEWPGEAYEGSSINGLMAYLKSTGSIGKYHWIRTLDDLKHTLSFLGPVIVGCEWREECFDPDVDGFIEFDGPNRGGHATCWRGINVEEEYFIIRQSWGAGHGKNGDVYITFADAEKLLQTRPQIAFPEKKQLSPSLTPKPRRWWQFWK